MGSVDLPLMSTFAKHTDERYPIHAPGDGVVIGELRLTAAFRDFAVLPRETYADLRVSGGAGRLARVVLAGADQQLMGGPSGLELLYALAAKGTLDELSDLLVRIGLAEGSLLQWLRDMCEFEAQASEWA